MGGESGIKFNEAQAEAVAHLAALMGAGELRADESEHLDWVWFRTARQDWCVDEKGRLRGWNEVEPDSERS